MRQPAGATPEGHGKTLWIAEWQLLGGVHAFFAERIFGPDRAMLLAEQLRDADLSAGLARWHRTDGIRQAQEDIAARRRRLLRTLELTDDPDGELTRDVNARALFDAFRLEIHYDRPANCARCRVTLTADSMRAVLDATSEAAGRVPFCYVPPTGFEPVLPP